MAAGGRGGKERRQAGRERRENEGRKENSKNVEQTLRRKSVQRSLGCQKHTFIHLYVQHIFSYSYK